MIADTSSMSSRKFALDVLDAIKDDSGRVTFTASAVRFMVEDAINKERERCAEIARDSGQSELADKILKSS